MKFETGNFADGTHFVGWFDGTRRQIESVLGAPNFTSSEAWEKVTIEWNIRFEDGTVATIYDWKRYSDEELSQDEDYRWHIGGTGLDAVRRVSDVLGIPATGQELVSY